VDNNPSAPQGDGTASLSGNVLFYKQPEPLSAQAHGALGVTQIQQPFGFLREAHAVPVTVTEFGMAASAFPVILLARTGHRLP